MTNFILFVLYAGLFAAYSIIDHYQNGHSKLGLTTSITVIIIDFFILLMFLARVVKMASFLAFLLFVIRILIFTFGKGGWIYGYMVAYILLGVVITHDVVDKRFPYSTQFDSLDFVNLREKNVRQFNDIARYPEALVVVISIAMIGTVAITTTFLDSDSVTINSFTMDYNNSTKGISPMLAAFGAVLVVITEAVFNIAWRTYIRKLNKVRNIQH